MRTGAAGPDRVVAPAAVALTVACGLLLTRGLLSLHSNLCCDSQGYFDLPQARISHGPRALASHIRTYGYPLFLALISFWQPRPIEGVHAAAASAQGALAGAAAVLGSAALIGLYIGFYLPTLVESRFATPVYLLGVPLFAVGVRLLSTILEERAGRRGLWIGCGGLAFLVACASLSGWIHHGHVVHSLDSRDVQPARQGAL